MQQIDQGILLKVKVIPKSSKSQIVGWENGELKIRLAAVPEKGRANNELIAFLAKLLGVAKSNIQLVRGVKSCHKQLNIQGFSLELLSKEIEGMINTK